MRAMMSLLRARRLPAVAPRYRSLSTSVRLLAHPDKDAPRATTSGEPVADLAKPDESQKGGVPSDDAPLAHTPALELFSLRNRTIIVTGAARGLGLTLAHCFIEAGAHVRCLDLLPAPAQAMWDETSSLARSRGLTLEYHPLDSTSEPSTRNVFQHIFASAPPDAPGRGMYVAAGINLFVPAVEFPMDGLRKVMDVNFMGTYLSAQAFAREYFKMNAGGASRGAGVLPAGQGASLVFTGSMSGHVANKGLENSVYNASKAAVNQLAKNLAMEWTRKGIRVNTISPGYILTSMTASYLQDRPHERQEWEEQGLIGRISTADEFRGPAIYLLSDASSFMTGADMLVDGGHTAT